MDDPMMQKMLAATKAINENAPGYVARPGARPNPNNPNWMANAAGPIRNI